MNIELPREHDSSIMQQMVDQGIMGKDAKTINRVKKALDFSMSCILAASGWKLDIEYITTGER